MVDHLGIIHRGNGGLKIAHKAFNGTNGGAQQGVNLFISFNVCNETLDKGAYCFIFPGFAKQPAIAPKMLILFHQSDGISLTGQGQGGCHTGNTSPHHQGRRGHRQLGFKQRGQTEGLGNGHSYQILGLGCGPLWLIGMNPRVLVSDVGHFNKILV